MKEMKRILALLLCLVMLVGVLPVSAFAAPGNNGKGPDKPGTVETVPVTEETVAPSEETTPVTEETAAPSEETTPVTEETTAPSEETTPVTEETEPPVVAVSGITLDQTALEVGVGAEPVTLVATVLPEDATDKTVTWTSSEPGVAAVADGVLTFGYMGEAVITATAGEFSATCTVTVGEGEWDTYEGGTVVIAGSDYQQSGTAPKTNTQNIMKAIQEDYPTADGFIFGGDYSQSVNSSSSTTSGINELKGVVEGIYGTGLNEVFVQGNHDAAVSGLTATGGHDADDYSVFVINEDDFSSSHSGSSVASTTMLTALENYLNEKVRTGYSKPVFVATHLPLHVTSRGDNKSAVKIFDLLNEAGASGLNIIFLFGHNHSQGYDAYLGNGAIYLPKGSSITVAGGSTSTLNFTYMNNGYVGYVTGSACTHLTMTTFEISDTQVIVKRYDANGEHTCGNTANVLKAAGVASGSYKADTTVVNSGAIIKLTTPTVGGDNEAVLESLTLAFAEEFTEYYFAVTEPVITGLEVTAVYSDGSEKELAWNGNVETVDGYALSFEDLTTKGEKTVTVSYGGKEATFRIYICEKEVEIEGLENAEVIFDTPSVTALTVEETEADETVTTALAGKLTGELTVYSITAEYAEGFDALSGTASVTVPLPAGLTNPEVWYVSEEGETEEMTVTAKTETAITFVTDHFSKFVVGESTEINVPDPESATVTKTETTPVTKNGVYVQVDTISEPGDYLIVNTSQATNNANLMTAAYSWRANPNYYVTRTTNVTVSEGTEKDSKKTVYYIENPANATIWTANGSETKYSLKNKEYENYYLYYNNGPTLNTTSYTWTVGTNTLRGARYIYCNSNGSWTRDNSGAVQKVYYYQKQNITLEKTVTNTGAFSIAGNPAKIDAVVPQTTSVTLGSTLTSTINGETSTDDTSTAATYEIVQGGDPNGVISDSEINNNVVTLSGKSGKALIKVSYTGTYRDETYTVSNYIEINAQTATYTIDITRDGKSVTDIIAEKNVTNGKTLTLGADLMQYLQGDTEGTKVTNPTLSWSSDNQAIATVNNDGEVTFTGIPGTTHISVYYHLSTGENAEFIYDTITITASPNDYYTPADGVTNFPEYPNPGSVNINKTATAVGNFNETGIAQIELSMTGIPTASSVYADVAIVLDQSTSMEEDHIAVTRNSTIAMLQSLLFDKGATEFTEATFNEKNAHRIYIGRYITENSDSVKDITSNEEEGFQKVTTFGEYETLVTKLETDYVRNATQNGTDWDHSLEKCYNLLNAARQKEGYDRPQFCVFMSDGEPGVYRYSQNQTTRLNYGTPSGWVTGNSRGTSYRYEYWSTKMKGEGVTVFSVMLNADGALAQFLMNDVAGPAKEETTDSGATMSKIYDGKADFSEIGDDDYFFMVTKEQAQYMTTVFSALGSRISQAATDVEVEDVISKDFELIFDIPNVKDEGNPVLTPNQTGGYKEFFIEVLEYELDSNHKRIWVEADKSYKYTTDIRIYLDSQGAYYYNDINEKARYQPYNAADGTGVTVEWNTNGENKTLKSIECAYFTYVAAVDNGNGKFNWKTDALNQESEIALRYFAYLKDSLEKMYDNLEGNELKAQSYQTNTYAVITYTNHLDNKCTQTFPVPQLTWSGAQVSYVFYLVNEDGLPVNKSGQVVDFANATEVTQVFEHPVVWNDADGVYSLEIDTAAKDRLPDYYKLYDENARYDIHVYRYAADNNVSEDDILSYGTNFFEIIGDKHINGDDDGVTTDIDYTTKVYNLKNGITYDVPGIYTADGKAFTSWSDGVEITHGDNNAVYKGFDFADTTVAFAVMWVPEAQPDTVVVDYGLDVLIDVTENDYFDNNVNRISWNKPAVAEGETAPKINESVYTTGAFTASTLGGDGEPYTISVESGSDIRFKQNTMEFKDPVSFYYDTSVLYYEGSTARPGYVYSQVTVIPATTVYYEDSFLDLTYKYLDKNDDVITVKGIVEDEAGPGWKLAGNLKKNAVQDEDRPGESKISLELDADNVYGYDNAYTECSLYSLDSAAKVNVSSSASGLAEFSFYGTGFDVIALTSNTTGAIIVDVYKGATATGSKVVSRAVDTYYGYTYDANSGEWKTTDSSDPNAIYQVPVMKISGLEYGQYTVKINATYISLFDQTAAEGYEMYLDAVRIYDPAGAGNQLAVDNNANGQKDEGDLTVSDVYKKDREGWPVYQELRNNVIAAADYVEDTVNGGLMGLIDGVTFIDGIAETPAVADYISYGPNNELYLAPGQAISFSLDLNEYGDIVDMVNLGIKSANGQPVSYAMVSAEKLITTVQSASNQAELDLLGKNPGANEADVAAARAEAEDAALKAILDENKHTVETSTDMYYDDIDKLKNEAIVIFNTNTDEEGGILSLTNIKVTFESAPADEVKKLFYVDYSILVKLLNAMQNFTGTQVAQKIGIKVVDEVTVGETFDVTVTTLLEADSVTIADADVNGTNGTTWTKTLTATQAGTMEIPVTVQTGEDVYSDTVYVLAVEKAAEHTLTVEVPESAVYGETFTVNVDAGENAESVTINKYTEVTLTDGVGSAELYAQGDYIQDAPQEPRMTVTVIAKYTDGSEVKKIAKVNIIPVLEVTAPEIVGNDKIFAVTGTAYGAAYVTVDNNDPVEVNPVSGKWSSEISLENKTANTVTSKTITVVAHNGVASTTGTASIDVYNFTPKYIQVNDSAAVASGEPVTVTVETSREVVKVVVEDTVITTYRQFKKDGETCKRWSAEVYLREEDDKMVGNVYAYNSEGYESAPALVEADIKDDAWPTFAQGIAKVINEIANFLRGLFK